MEYIDSNIGKQKRIALVAHDNMKIHLIDWVKKNKDILKKHFLFGTGTTAKLISESVELPVRGFKSGPMGGDQQLGSRIAEETIDVMIFFWDPLEAQPHDPDVKALLRISVLYDIPVANNRATADFILSSPLMDSEYNKQVVDYTTLIKKRTKHFLDIDE